MTTKSELLADAISREWNNLLSLSIRELISHWGASRRGYWIVEQVRRDLDEAGLVSEPPFETGWIDARIRLIPRRLKDNPDETLTTDEAAEPAENLVGEEITLKVATLRSASTGVCQVNPQGDLLEAQSLMVRHDYSQLAVMATPRELVGAITWESIAQARVRSDTIQLRDCVVGAEVVRLEDDLLPIIPKITEAGFVFVHDHEKNISGIVTTADVSSEFIRLAQPFFLIGEIERRLRKAISNRFSADELRDIVDPADATREVQGADDLTLGEYKRLLENPDHWKKVNWPADRKVFIEALDEVRELRNDVMHFSPDPLEEIQNETLRLFVRWLKFLEE